MTISHGPQSAKPLLGLTRPKHTKIQSFVNRRKRWNYTQRVYKRGLFGSEHIYGPEEGSVYGTDSRARAKRAGTCSRETRYPLKD